METIYFDECHHIEAYGIKSSKCLKRVFYIRQAHEPDHKIKQLVVCNELIKLKFINNALNDDYGFIGEGHYYNRSYDGVVDEIISTAFPVRHPIPDITIFLRRSYHPINPIFAYVICKRPCLIRWIYLYDAIKLINEYGWPNTSDNFQERTASTIVETGERILRDNKIKGIKKSTIKDVEVILNRFKKYYRIGSKVYFNMASSYSEFETNITKLLIDFMEIQSTFKIKER